MKVILEYDPSTGSIQDRAGIIVGTWMNLDHFPADKPHSSDLVNLKAAGYTVEEIKQLHEANLI